MNYLQAKEFIEDGDLIAVKGKEGFLTPFTKFFTRSPYTHVGVAFWMHGGLWLAEINAGANHATPLSQFSNVDFDVYDKPKEATGSIKDAIDTALRVKIHYSFSSLFIIGFTNYFKIKERIRSRKLLSCAGFSSFIYEIAGMPESTRVLSPAELARKLSLRLQVTGDPGLILSPM